MNYRQENGHIIFKKLKEKIKTKTFFQEDDDCLAPYEASK